MKGSSRQSNTQDQSLLLILEYLSVCSLSHLLQKRDKVLRIGIMTTSLLVRRAKEAKSTRGV